VSASDSTFVATRFRSGGCRATLRCGVSLYFETVNLAPVVAELVPCLRHGYCEVRRVVALTDARPVGETRPGETRPGERRSPRRSSSELVAHLSLADEFTLAELRRARFSLRLITQAAREGLVHLEEHADTVIVRSLGPARADGHPEATSLESVGGAR